MCLADDQRQDMTWRGAVEAFGLCLHQFGLLAHLLEPERTRHPDRLPFDETFDVLAADQRKVLAELDAVEIEQALSMPALLL
jgi:hypothetical protein